MFAYIYSIKTHEFFVMKYPLSWSLAVLVLLTACLGTVNQADDVVEARFLILNKGIEGLGPAELTTFDSDTRQVKQNVYALANNGAQLGQGLHSGLYYRNDVYLVLKQNHRIEIVDARTFVSRRSVQLPPSARPQYITISEDERTGYVSNLGSQYIYSFDILTGELTDSLYAGARSSDIIYVNGNIYVARALNEDGELSSGVVVIEAFTGQILHEIPTLPGPARFVPMLRSLWVGSSGAPGQSNGGIAEIDVVANTILRELPMGGYLSAFTGSPSSGLLYMIVDGVLKAGPLLAPEMAFDISSNNYTNMTVYNLGDDVIFASDNKNGIAPGIINMYLTNGLKLDSIPTNYAPGNVLIVPR
jgi:hypothetical protein